MPLNRDRFILLGNKSVPFFTGGSMENLFFRRWAVFSICLMVLLISSETWTLGQHRMHTTRHGFEDIDRWVSIFESPERSEWQKPDEVVKRMNLKTGDVVADIGAGTGYFTRRFAVAVGPSGKALGLDIEPSMVAYMKKDAQKLGLNNYEARVVAPDDPGLREESVDVIFICNTYHHIENRVAYLKNLIPALKPGGRIIIVDFYKKDFPVGPPPEMKLSEEEVKEEFLRAGYQLSGQLDFLPYQYYLEFKPGEKISRAIETSSEGGRNLIMEEMAALNRAFKTIVDAVILGDLRQIIPALTEVHEARERVEKAVESGQRIMLPRNQDRFEEFVELETNFIESWNHWQKQPLQEIRLALKTRHTN